jgi:hypothetical protein
MTFLEQPVEQEQYRVLLMLPTSKMALVENHGGSLRLPRIGIPRWTRVGEELAEAVRTKWGVRSIVIDFLPEPPDIPKCAVMEIRSHDNGPIFDRLIRLQIDALRGLDLTAAEHAVLQEILMGATTGRGPFSHLGWIEEAQEWIRASVPDRAVAFNDDIRGSNAGGAFALVRFGTVYSPAYWLKATGAPNAHEFAVTTTLARLYPDYLPPLVTAREDWNAWVTEEVGKPLDESFALPAFENATHSIAKLQIASADNVDAMFSCGCFDQRIPILRAHLAELTQYLEESMTRQISTRVPPIEARRLRELEFLLEEACDCMSTLGIPDTLIHNDMNAGNILIDGSRAVLTDWAEAYIGNPFFTFHHLWTHALQADSTQTWARKIRTIYTDHWRCILGDAQIARAMALCPPLAMVSYLCGRDTSFELSYREDARHQSYARSLARHMDRVAQAPEFLEALCH